MLSTEKTIGFVIPTYGAKGILLTKKCLETLREYHPFNEVIVVDDGSDLEVQEALSFYCNKFKAKLLTSFHNQGFSHSVNRGIEQSQSDIVVLTNNDIEFTQNITDNIIEIFNKDSKIGIIGFLLLFPNGNIQHGGHCRLDDSENMHHVEAHVPLENSVKSKQSRYIIGVTGALQAISKEMCNKTGLYSTKYQMAYEDVEFCLRAWHLGYRIYYSADVSAIHAEGVTRGKNEATKKLAETYDREISSRIQYGKDVKTYNIPKIEKIANELNIETKLKKYKNENSNIIGVVRMQALGDCIMITGIVKELKKRHPESKIFVFTKNPYCFYDNNYVDEIFDDKKNLGLCSVVYDLDLCYERQPKKKRLDAYAQEVFIKNDYNKEDIKPFLSDKVIGDVLKTDREYIVIHPCATWESRTLSKEVWDEIIDYLILKGYVVVCVGSNKDIKPTPRKDLYTVSLSLWAVRKAIKEAQLFIGLDSGIMHIAQTTKTKIIGIFTVADPDVVVWREENFTSIIPQSECKFCLQRGVPLINNELKNSEPDCSNPVCVKSITAIQIIEAIEKGDLI